MRGFSVLENITAQCQLGLFPPWYFIQGKHNQRAGTQAGAELGCDIYPDDICPSSANKAVINRVLTKIEGKVCGIIF